VNEIALAMLRCGPAQSRRLLQCERRPATRDIAQKIFGIASNAHDALPHLASAAFRAHRASLHTKPIFSF
jgi:hypothetical protein